MANSRRFIHIDTLRVVAIFFVVATHARAYVPLDPASRDVIGLAVQTIGVPVFFLADGFLFCSKQIHAASLGYGRYIARSARRLLFPWFLFSSVYMLSRYASERFNLVNEKILVGQSLKAVLLALYTSSTAPQMYFLLSLFLIRMISPLSYSVSRARLEIPVIIFLLYTAIYHTLRIGNYFRLPFDPFRHALWGLQYYLLGIVLCRYHEQIFQQAYTILFCSLGILLTILVTKQQGLFFVGFQYAYLLAAYTCLLVKQMKGIHVLSTLGKYTMGIYLVHSPLILKGLSLIFAVLLPGGAIAFILLSVTAFLVSLLLTRAIMSIPHGGFIFGESIQV